MTDRFLREDRSGYIVREAGGYLLRESSPRPRRPGRAYPGGWVPDKLYTPPRRKITEGKIEALKELYEEAKREIPEPLQHSLIPGELLRLRSRASASLLPPVSAIDFEALARSLETIRVLIAAIETAYQQKAQADEAARAKEQEEEKRRLRRRRDEEALILLMMEL